MNNLQYFGLTFICDHVVANFKVVQKRKLCYDTIFIDTAMGKNFVIAKTLQKNGN